jgi:hypothetical protein
MASFSDGRTARGCLTLTGPVFDRSFRLCDIEQLEDLAACQHTFGQLHKTASITHQATGDGEIARLMDGGNRMADSRAASCSLCIAKQSSEATTNPPTRSR